MVVALAKIVEKEVGVNVVVVAKKSRVWNDFRMVKREKWHGHCRGRPGWGRYHERGGHSA